MESKISANEIVRMFFNGCLNGVIASQEERIIEHSVLRAAWKHGYQVGLNITFGRERLN